MKHIRTILAAAVALSLCGCAQSTSEPAQNEYGTLEAMRLSDEQSEPEVVRPSLKDDMVVSVPVVEETADTRLAVDFIYDFYDTLAFHDESALDLDKYFGDGELKEQMAECKKSLLNKTTFYEKENFAIDYAAAVSDKTMDGVHHITVAYAYQYRQPSEEQDGENWSGSGMGAPFAIKNGKIVNLAVDEFFAPLPSDENVPEVQVVTSHITAVRSDTFELDGVTYAPYTDRCDIVIEDGGFIKLLTPEGLMEPVDYKGEMNQAVEAVKEIFTLGNLGNTGRIEVGGVTYDDAVLYRFGEKLLLVGDITPPTGFDNGLGSYHTALIFAPVPYKPFDGKTILRINIHCKYDLYDPVELSAEDRETLSEMLGRVELVGEKMDKQKLIPYSGNSPASFTVFFEDGEKVGFAAESGIGYPDGTDGGAYIINGDYYAVDKQIVREITDFYHDVLLDKYIPEYRASYAPDPRDLESAESQKTADGKNDSFMPFVKTSAAEYAYIELVLSGIDAMNEDGTPREPARLSDEDAEMLFDLLEQISIDSPPINGHTWEDSPDGGYGAVFNVCRKLSDYDNDVSTVTVIPYMGRIYLNSMAFPIDTELSSQLSARYNELYIKYYPDLAEKWNLTVGE